MTAPVSRAKAGAARRYKTKEDPRPCDGCAFSQECAVAFLRCPRFTHWADSGKDDESKALALGAQTLQLKFNNTVRN